MNCAVIDLGTNTFHLMIAKKVRNNEFEVIFKTQQAVKLGKGGINKQLITEDALQRGWDALVSFKNIIDKYQVSEIKAIATSAIRDAKNGGLFVTRAEQLTNINITVIDGDTEAEYIYNGVKAAINLSNETSLLMDIGGGSVEFILCNQQQIFWKKSYQLGAARLIELFHTTDPITKENINNLEIYLNDQLKDLFKISSSYPPKNLIGTAGAFESFAEIISFNKNEDINLETFKSYLFDNKELVHTLNNLVQSTHQERLVMKGLATIRIDMIVVAAILSRFIIEKLPLKHLKMTTYSLKEGVLESF